MIPTPSEAQARPGVPEQVATRVVFFVAGLVMAAWAPLVPLAKTRLGLDDRQLGWLLLCLGLGSVLGMPLSGSLAGRFGCRRVILVAGVLACSALPVMATASNPVLLAAGLLLFGAGVGTVDVVMNIQAVIVEKASGRTMMSGFHGLFSVGGIAGAGGLTGLLALRLPPLTSVLITIALGISLLGFCAKGLLPYGTEDESPPFALPSGRVLLIGALCCVLFLAEGSVLDWSGVLLTSVRGIDERLAGLGYVAFAATMTLGRLTGDRIVSKVGATRILFLGGILASTGFALAALVPAWPATILGFALVGAGASNTVPVLFTAAGAQKSMPSNLAIAAATTMGYAGILAGPGLIGLVAQATNLPLALSGVAVLLLGVAVSARAATA